MSHFANLSPIYRSLGATRDHTTTFLHYRNDRKQRSQHFGRKVWGKENVRSAGRENLIPQSDPYSDDVVIGVNTLPLGPSWVNKFDNTNEKIKEIKNKMKYLKKLQIERIKPNFDEEAVEKLDKEIGTLMLDLTILLQKSEQNVTDIISMKIGTSKTDEKIRKNVQLGLASQLQELTVELRRSEKEYYLKLKEFHGEDNYLKSKLGETEEQFLNDDSEMQLAELEMVDRQRDVELHNLVKSINDLAVIFKELSIIVVDQGTILDRIDYNIESALDHTERGNKELHKAERYQKARIKGCLCFLIVGILIMTVLLVLKHI